MTPGCDVGNRGHGLTANVGCMYIHRHYVHAECRNLQWLVMQGRRHNVIDLVSKSDLVKTSSLLRLACMGSKIIWFSTRNL